MLLFGTETWVVTPCMGRVLGGFLDQVTRSLTGWLPRQKPYRKLEYTSAATARAEVKFQTMQEYVWRGQNTFLQYIATQSLMDLCEGTERSPGSQVGMQWWDQVDINLAGARETTAESAEEEEDRVEEWQRVQKLRLPGRGTRRGYK